MIENFIKIYAQKIVAYPEQVSVSVAEIEPNFREIKVLANAQDVGRLIGKEGKMIGSLKALISGARAKDSVAYRIVVESV